MLAATYTQGGSFEVSDVPVPDAAPDEMLLRVTAAAICGTDLKTIRNGSRRLAHGATITLGHEFVGRVEAVGRDVEGYEEGQRVGLVPNAGCGACHACIRGMANYCSRYTAFGIDRDGAHASYVKIPARFISQGNVVVLPDSLDDVVASLLEPASCALNGVRACSISPGDTVVIYGAGPMGLLILQLAIVSGAARTVVVDVREDRLERAGRLGADVTVSADAAPERLMDLTAGAGVDVAITACAVGAVQRQALDVLASFGRLCLFGGLPSGKSNVAFDSNAVHYRNLTITGTTGGSGRDYRSTMALVASGRIDPRQLISDRYEMPDLERAYRCALEGAEGKVVLVSEGAR